MKNYKFWIGILISGIFVYFTFKGVDLKKFLSTLAGINYLYLPLLLLLLFVAFYVRALRWRYLLGKEIKIKTHSLFSYIMIGFMANNVLPARIGEFVRAYIIGKKENISKSFAFSTIVVERVFDGMVVLLIFIPTIFLYPFPDPLPVWIKLTGFFMGLSFPLILMFLIILKVHKEWVLRIVEQFIMEPTLLAKTKQILTSFIQGLMVILFLFLPTILFYSLPEWVKKTGLLVGLFYPLILVILIILKIHKEWVLKLYIEIVLNPISPTLLLKVKEILTSFIQGLDVLHKFNDLIIVLLYSLIIWIASALMFYVGFLCFSISLPFYACFFVIGPVIVGLMIPASPGSVGTFHYPCYHALLLLLITQDKNLASSYAFFMHMINYLPITSVGFLYLIKENISFGEIEKTSDEA